MVRCPNCNSENDENSMFCQSCGTKLEVKKPMRKSVEKIDDSSSIFEAKKTTFKIILGYLPILIQIFALIGADGSVKVINADRYMLYPLICFAITFYAASKLIENEETFKHAIIILAISAFLVILSTIVIL